MCPVHTWQKCCTCYEPVIDIRTLLENARALTQRQPVESGMQWHCLQVVSSSLQILIAACRWSAWQRVKAERLFAAE